MSEQRRAGRRRGITELISILAKLRIAQETCKRLINQTIKQQNNPQKIVVCVR